MSRGNSHLQSRHWPARWARWLLAAGALVLTLLVVEVALRLRGDRPGWLAGFAGPFEPVDVLVVENSFFTDEEGIFRANPDHDWPEDTHVNDEGFRSIPFRPDAGDATSILFLGDSFTWGASAEPLTSSFVDLVGQAGFTCFTAGIPGTDPEQYARVGEKWIPRLRPDVVAVMVYLGNDIHRDLLDVPPGQSLWYVTSAGWILGFDLAGEPLPTAGEAYDYYLHLYNRIGRRQHGALLSGVREALTTTAIGTRLWAIVGENGDDSAATGATANPPLKLQRALALRARLERIRTAATSVAATFRLYLIPVRPSAANPQNRVEGNVHLFQGFGPRVPPDLTEADYTPPPGLHLNNQGHAKLAHFVLETLLE